MCELCEQIEYEDRCAEEIADLVAKQAVWERGRDGQITEAEEPSNE